MNQAKHAEEFDRLGRADNGEIFRARLLTELKGKRRNSTLDIDDSLELTWECTNRFPLLTKALKVFQKRLSG